MHLSKFVNKITKLKLYTLFFASAIVFINSTNIYSDTNINATNTAVGTNIISNLNELEKAEEKILDLAEIINNNEENAIIIDDAIVDNKNIKENINNNVETFAEDNIKNNNQDIKLNYIENKNNIAFNNNYCNNYSIVQKLSNHLLQVSASIKAYKQENYFKINENKFFNNFFKSNLLDNDFLKQENIAVGSGIFTNLKKILYKNFFDLNLINNQDFLKEIYTKLESNNSNAKQQYLLTNYHIVENASQILVQLYQNSNIDINAKILTYNKELDLALLEVDYNINIPTTELGMAESTGQDILLLGSPFGLEFTIAKGIISYKDRIINTKANIKDDQLGINMQNQIKYLQIDSLINNGNSGGPIFNYDGKLIGILSGIFAFSNLETGIGFAIPTPTLNYFINSSLINKIDFGMQYENFIPNKKTNINLNNIKDNPFGIIITSIEKDNIAEKIGLMQNDRILSCNNQPVYNDAIFNFLIHNLKSNENISLEIMRQDKIITIKTIIPVINADNYIEYKGIKFANITTNLLNKYKFINNSDDSNSLKGAIVVATTSYFPGNLLKEGDIITALNNEEIKDLNDLDVKIKKLDNNKVLLNIKKPTGTATISFYENKKDLKNIKKYKMHYSSKSESYKNKSDKK